MAKLEVVLRLWVDTDEYVEPTPKFEEDPEGFVSGVVDQWRRYGFDEDPMDKVLWSGPGYTEHELGVVPA